MLYFVQHLSKFAFIMWKIIQSEEWYVFVSVSVSVSVEFGWRSEESFLDEIR